MKKKIGLVVFSLLLIFVLLIIFRKDNIVQLSTVIEKYETPNSHFFNWNGQNYHYVKQGEGNEVILMIHGFGGSYRNFLEISEILDKNYTIYSLDLPAFGLSEVPSVVNNPPKDMMAFHQEFFNQFYSATGIDTFHVIGNSMGGMMAWYLTSQNPKIKSLTLLNSAGYGMAEVKEKASGWMTSSLAKWIFKKGVPLSKAKSNAERCFYDETVATKEGYTANYYMNNKSGTFDWMVNLASAEILPDTNLIKTIKTPSLIVWGDQDKIISVTHADKFARDIENSKVLIYENCGHIPQIEYPEKLVEDWLAFTSEI